MNLVEGQGWPDFTMLDDSKVNEDGFMDNLTLRFEKKQIYTYIGEQVVVMNPYQRLPIYGKETMDAYRDKYLYEVQPHVYALGDDTFRALRQRKRDQCVIVTGESGAGKTEAAKQFMEYLTYICAGGPDAEVIKKKLLDSNPVLEAFGNAKTQRNDNSSRFGKYMEIQFDGAGKPLGGAIRQYLLEKSRVVDRSEGERSFHIFYLLLTDPKTCSRIGLKPDPSEFKYLTCSKELTVERKDEKAEWKEVMMAMDSLSFSEDHKDAVWKVLAAILYLGNVEFKIKDPEPDDPKGVDMARVSNMAEVACEVGRLLGVDPVALERCLVQRSISTGVGRRTTSISIFHDVKAATATRDSLAKALYNSIFSYVTTQTNKAIVTQATGRTEAVVGILDIYGFEIFDCNSFEQFCINYCNEKLQQLFIKLVLRTEQEEYRREGIEWTDIEYFDNAPIVNLLDGKGGLYKLLDEACNLGNSTPATLLDKFNQHIVSDRYSSDERDRKAHIATGAFRVMHYAGNVDYEVDLFLTKNKDTLFQDVCTLIHTSTMENREEILFPQFVLIEAGGRRKRPKTAGKMFVEDLSVLVDTLEKCQPHYIRCIKPNDEKKVFNCNEERTRHQVRYLNVVETVRVRKAGFCNRQPYPRFFPRYKALFEGDWFKHSEEPREGTINLFNELNMDPEEYRSGKTQIFIRNVQTLMKLEEARNNNLPRVAIGITRRWKGYLQRIEWEKKEALHKIQRFARGYLVRKRMAKLRAPAVPTRAALAFAARKVREQLWVVELKKRLDVIRNLSATKIQKVVRGIISRTWLKEHKRLLEMEREERELEKARQEAAKKIQRFYKRHLVLQFVKKSVTCFCNLDKPPKNFGKHIEFPKPVGQANKENLVVLRRVRLRWWAWQMVRYHKALVVIQKAYRERLRRLYVKAIAQVFTLKQPLGKGLYVEKDFGKHLEFPLAITATTKAAEPGLRKMHKAWVAYQLIRWLRATEVLQRTYRKRLEKLYLKALSAAVAVAMPDNYSKEMRFPRPIAPGCKECHVHFIKMHHQFWAHQKLHALAASPSLYARMKLKLQGLEIYRGSTGWSDPWGDRPWGYDLDQWKLNKHWAFHRKWDALYLELSGSPKADENATMIRSNFAANGDSDILFCDNLIKVNRHGKNQLQTITVTDMHIYKKNPKNLKDIKEAIPLDACVEIVMSPHSDHFVILKFTGSNYRDMVLNAGNHGEDHTSELVSIVRAHAANNKKNLPVNFVETVTYNNSRQEGKPGEDITLNWQSADEKDKAKMAKELLGNCMWKKGAVKGTAQIVYF